MKKDKKAFIEIDPGAIDLLKSAAQVALAIVGGAAALTVAVAMPGLAQVLGREIKKYESREMRRIYIRERFDPLGRETKKYNKSRQTLYYLRRQGYIRFNSRAEDSVIKLTEKGKVYLRRLHLLSSAPRKPKVWDKTWWIVLADIPTKTHRSQSELLRLRLKNMGFYPLQRTVWVHPYNSVKAINELTRYYDLGKYVTLLQATMLDAEDIQKLKRYFNL